MTTIDVTTEGRPAREVLAWSRVTVEPALRAAVDTLTSSMLRVAGYHFGWWNEHGHPPMAPKNVPSKNVDPKNVDPKNVTAVSIGHGDTMLRDQLFEGLDRLSPVERLAWSAIQFCCYSIKFVLGVQG
ncbi:MAG: hypothetical protein JO364_03600, partial [Pseudonocardiales bacterium]|nr:hypothetical protein [Pseudonocardiales bacterium]